MHNMNNMKFQYVNIEYFCYLRNTTSSIFCKKSEAKPKSKDTKFQKIIRYFRMLTFIRVFLIKNEIYEIRKCLTCNKKKEKSIKKMFIKNKNHQIYIFKSSCMTRKFNQKMLERSSAKNIKIIKSSNLEFKIKFNCKKIKKSIKRKFIEKNCVNSILKNLQVLWGDKKNIFCHKENG